MILKIWVVGGNKDACAPFRLQTSDKHMFCTLRLMPMLEAMWTSVQQVSRVVAEETPKGYTPIVNSLTEASRVSFKYDIFRETYREIYFNQIPSDVLIVFPQNVVVHITEMPN